MLTPGTLNWVNSDWTVTASSGAVTVCEHAKDTNSRRDTIPNTIVRMRKFSTRSLCPKSRHFKLTPALVGESRRESWRYLLILAAGECGARHVGMPVHECAGRVFLPCPHMQCVERRESETVGSFKVMKELSHQLWRGGVCRIPGLGEHEVVRADQLQASVRLRFVDHDLGARCVQDAIHHQRKVHEMHAHGARIGTTDAAELQEVSGSLSCLYILEALGRLADGFDQSIRLTVGVHLVCRGHRMLLLGRHARNT